MIIYLPFLVALIGVLMFALSGNAKLSEIGRIAFAIGLLVGLIAIHSHVLRFP